MSFRILVVEDEPDQRRLVVELLSTEGYALLSAGTVDSAWQQLTETPVDVVLCDWKLPTEGGGDGMNLLARLKQLDSPPAFIMATAYGTIHHAVTAVRGGANDYLTKPFDRSSLLLAVERTLRARQLEAENRRLTAEVGDRDRLVDLVGRSPAMQRVFSRVQKVAGTEATILLTGESGTGKELAARALHRLSGRAEGPFVAVNCAAIPDGLVESEFFGAERGAFTGADRMRIGTLEAARGGSLFLDEVGELPLAVQPKLLRALQERRFTRVGGHRELETDARIIAATNRDLREEVAEGRFREDLYYRLAVVSVEMPPLRERQEDVALLIEHLLDRSCRRHGTRVELPGPVLRSLVGNPWPGNVRELANAIERLVLLAEEGIASVEDLPPSSEAPEHPEAGSTCGGFQLPSSGISFDALEREVLRQALVQSEGNRAQAARLLGLPYKALLYRLQKHGFEDS